MESQVEDPIALIHVGSQENQLSARGPVAAESNFALFGSRPENEEPTLDRSG